MSLRIVGISKLGDVYYEGTKGQRVIGRTNKTRAKRSSNCGVQLGGAYATNAQAFVCMSIGNLGDMPSSSSLLGLPVASCQSVLRDSTMPTATTQGTLGLSTSSLLAGTSTTWSRLDVEPSLLQLPQHPRSLRGGREFACILQTSRADSPMGVH